MQLIFLPSTEPDFRWIQHYYASIFPQGKQTAQQHIRAAMRLLNENPYVGQANPEHAGVRELSINKTPFSIIYRLTPQSIEVLRLWDQRQESPSV
jgi:plasmid stabilization system protein ParE